MTTYEIRSVEMRDVHENGHNWVVVTTRPNGVPHTLSFPHITFAARAAEYGIDLSDIDTLLDICLHEGFEGIDHTHPDFVYNNHEDHARTALMSRIADTKQRHLVTDPGNLLQAVRKYHGENHHRSFHDQHRARVAGLRSSRITAGEEAS
jgi:hypothetical protein